MGRSSKLTAVPFFLLIGAVAFCGCSTVPEVPPPAPEPVSVAPVPPVTADPPKSVMFDSDPNGEWNLFPDPTTGEIGVYHKDQYLGAIDGQEKEDPPLPHDSKRDRDSVDDAP
jgi:hypothetical protein